ncbi:MAG: hypothetical protein JJLCMIEE_02765 [Acidimicrobiales bacterium]|nr:MAG: phosphate ABC transporter permease PstA [Actinomycetota bacterium]MBV6509669.1 hypothetical protein [Acidimicrobiales bacterium]RIK06359.1 MAG: phosphate ABC transporter permease PtsA [Acidobacteriota bacterium]
MTLVNAAATTDRVRLALSSSGHHRRGRAFKYALLASLLISLAVLVILVGQVLATGWPVFVDRGPGFLSAGLSGNPETAGVWQALKGTFWIGVIVIVVAFPNGVAAAIYLEEYAKDTRLNRFINVNIRNLAGVPSIVYGILGFTIFVEAMGGLTGGISVIAGGVTLAVLVLPIVIITSMEALRAVPNSIREAGYGVGATRWEVIRSHVLPYAAPGLLTGTVLSLARALGEAAPLILVGAKTGFFSLPGSASFVEELTGPFTALPITIYDWSRKPGEGWQELAAAAIIVILVVTLTANTVAILLRNRYDKKRSA